jgi:Flp pilus assembly protein TadG
MLVRLRGLLPAIFTNNSQGQSLVELAIFLLMLSTLLFGGLDLGRVFYYQVSITDAARQGVRTASNSEIGNSEIRNAVHNASSSTIQIPDSNIEIDPPSVRVKGQPVTVTIRYPFTPVTPVIGQLMGSKPIVASAAGVVQ